MPDRSGQTPQMTGYMFTLGDARLTALASGALHWPEKEFLVVSDLHFGRSERLARRGGALLPPYETSATLARLEADLATTGATNVICLGDSFDSLTAAAGLSRADQAWLSGLIAHRNWHWLEGNHDPAATAFAGHHHAALTLPPLTFRHIGGGEGYEISGHYHPKARHTGRSMRCFLIDTQRVVMPAYGEYTGGLWVNDAALTRLMHPSALAVLTGRRTLLIPMPR